MNSCVFRRPFRVYHVKQHYVVPTLYVLTMYSLGSTKSGVLRWLYQHYVSVGANKKHLQERMYRYNKREGVPTLQGLKHGYRLSCKHYHKLLAAGLLEESNISIRGDYYVVS